MTFVWVLAAIVAMSVVATLLTRGTVALMGRFGGEAMQRTMRDTEYVVEHHAVPPAWKSEIERRFRGLAAECTDAALAEKHRARAVRECHRRLDRLLTFAKKSSIVADEETRGILIAELAQVRGEWRGRGWEAMCAPDAGSHPTATEPVSED